jgi:outer membrane protein TolC
MMGACILVLAAGGRALAAQEAATPAAMLTLDGALATARTHNRRLQAARLDVEKATQQIAAAVSHRRPVISVNATAGSLLAPLNFRFDAGSFGVFPSIGPVPRTDTTIRTDPGFTTLVFASVVQPLSQLPRIHKAERAAALSRDIAREQVRALEAEIGAAVKRLYYGIVQAEAGLRARAESLRLQRELMRLVDGYVEQRVVLPGEALTVRASLLQQEHEIAQLRNAAAGYREQLNNQIGRELDEPFAVESLRPAAVTDDDLRDAESRAIADRPEARISRLQSEQAELDLAATKRPAIPDASLAFNYTGFYGFEVIPHHGAVVGVLASWEPWDWGRQRAERARKRLTQQQSTAAVGETEAQMRLDVRARFRTLKDSYDLIRVREAARDAARERLRVATERFQVNAALERELLEAQARLAQSDFDYQQAIAGYWMARADFERARGES